jgi:hypothetical protein
VKTLFALSGYHLVYMVSIEDFAMRTVEATHLKSDWGRDLLRIKSHKLNAEPANRFSRNLRLLGEDCEPPTVLLNVSE